MHYCTNDCRRPGGHCPTSKSWPVYPLPMVAPYPGTLPPMNTNQGWLCPKCGESNAPFVQTCPCRKSNVYK